MAHGMRFWSKSADITVCTTNEENKTVTFLVRTGCYSDPAIEFDEKSLRELRKWLTIQIRNMSKPKAKK